MKHHFSDFVRRVKAPDTSPLRKLRSLLMLFIMLSGFSQAWAQDSFTITFKDSGGTGDSSTKQTTIAGIITDGADYVSSLSGVSNVYQAREGRGIKLGTSKATGSLTLNLKKEYKVSSIVVEARYYNNTETTLKIQDQTDYELTDEFETYEYTYSESTKISSITIGSTSKRNYITSITVYYETLDGIEISSCTPTKTNYAVGDYFEPAGMTAVYYYSDASTEDVPADEITWTVNDEALNAHPLTLDDGEYGITVEATVTVNSVVLYDYCDPIISVLGITGIEIEGTPKTNYNDGETFDVTGLTVNYIYSDDSREAVSADDITWTIDGNPISNRHFDVNDDQGTFSIAAHVGNYDSDDLEVTISVLAVSYIEVSGEPNKKNYNDGDAFDPTGLIVEYVYTDNTRQTVDPAIITWYFWDSNLTVGQTETQVYAVVNTFDSEWYTVTGLTVLPTLEYIELSGTPDKTDYVAGEIFDPTGLIVNYVYSDDSRVEVDAADITWNVDPAVLVVGEYSVTVTAAVGEMSDWNNYDITVTAPSYEKVTAEQEDWSGEYLLVYEDGNTAFVWDGTDAADCYETADIVADVIERPDYAAILTIEKVAESDPVVYTIKMGNKYIGQTSNSNGIKIQDNPINNTISFATSAIDIVASSAHLRYNSASSQFRYYKSSTYTAQQPVQLYKRVDNRANSELAWSANSVSLKVGETFTAPTLSYSDGFDGAADIVISSDNTNLATVDNGVVSLVAEASGTAHIKAVFAGNDNYRPAVVSYTISVSKTSPELAWSKQYDEITIGDAWTAPTLDNPHNVAVSFESDNASVATVSNEGVISLAGGTGTAVITASFDGNAYYYSDIAAYTITVNPFNPVTVNFFAPVAWGNDVKAYVWTAPFAGDYPMTATGTGRWFTCEIPENVPFLIYTGEWADQTTDLAAISEDKCFTWTTNRENNKIIPAEVTNCQMNYAIAGTLPGIGWDVTDFAALNEYNRITFNNLPAGTYQFKINNGTWAWNVGYAYADADNSNIQLSDDNGNVQFTTTSVMNVTIEYNPATEKITVNGEIVFNPDIEFNKTHVVIDGANITTTASDDSNGNIWSIAVEGSNVYHASYQGYEQVGSNANPASKITFTTTLAELPYRAQVSDVTIRLSGNSSTSANVSIKVDDEVIGSGYLSGSEVVLISSNKVAIGQTLTITINNISSAIKCYGIEYVYETFESVAVKFFPPRDESHKWEHVYAQVYENGHVMSWPGEEITASKNSNWFTYYAEKGATFRFHDNEGWQFNGLTVNEDKCFIARTGEGNVISLVEDANCAVDYYILGSAALMGGDADWTQALLLENGSITFEDVQPTGEDSLVFKINNGTWAWSIGDSKLNPECASIATAGENNNVQFKTNTKQNITISYDPATDKICLDAELVKWPASIGEYQPVEMVVNDMHYIQPATTVPENSEIKYEITEGEGIISISGNSLDGYRIYSNTAVGEATVRAYIEESELYTAAETFFTVKVEKIHGYVYAGNIYDLVIDDSKTAYLTTNISGYADTDVSYTIESGSEFINVDNSGLVTGLAAGIATVRVTIAEQPLYTSATNTFNVTVVKKSSNVSAKVNPLSLKVNELKNLEFETNISDYTADQVDFTVISGGDHIQINKADKTITGLSQGAAQVRITIASTATYEEATNVFDVYVALNGGYVNASDLPLKVNETKSPEYVTSNTGAQVTYTAVSGAEFIEIDNVNGTITGKAEGQAVVKIEVAATAVYEKAENTFTVNVSRKPGTATINDMILEVNGVAKSPEIFGNTNIGAAINYSLNSGDNCISIDNANGTISGTAAGDAVVKAVIAATVEYNEVEVFFNVKVNKQEGSVSASDLPLKVNETKSPEYVTSNTGAQVTYTAVSGAEFIEIDNVNGTITGKAKGSAVVKISVAATAVYEKAENTFTVSVTKYAGTVTIADNLFVEVGDQVVPEFETNVPGGVAQYEFVTGDDCVQIDNESGTITCTAVGSAVLKISIIGNDAYEVPNRDFTVNVSEQPTPEPVYETVRENLQIGRYYTICMPKNIIAVQGATFWTISKRNSAATLAYLEEVPTPLTAGAPYIFLATADKLEVVYGEESESAPIANGALRGTFDHMYQDDFNSVSAANNNSVVYMLVSNTLRIVSGAVTGNHLSPYRAYVLDNAFEIVNTAPQSAPGRRVVSMPLHPNTPTGLDEEMNADGVNIQKRIIDNQLFIIVGDQMYDATGHLVK